MFLNIFSLKGSKRHNLLLSILQYFLPFAAEGINKQIEDAILKADKIGVKVISLAALNKVRSVRSRLIQYNRVFFLLYQFSKFQICWSLEWLLRNKYHTSLVFILQHKQCLQSPYLYDIYHHPLMHDSTTHTEHCCHSVKQ